MPPAVASLMFAAGLATWIYSKVNRSTGGNTQNSLIVSGIAFVFSFIIFSMIMGAIERYLQ